MPSVPNRKIVLHICDNEDDQYLVKRTVKSVQSTLMIRQVENADDAVEFLNQAKLFNDLPCLIIMDMELTINGQNGYKELRNDLLLRKIPLVVFYTADSNYIRNTSRSKIIFIPRPLKYKDFEKSIKKALSYCS